MTTDDKIVINGWEILVHPVFARQLEILVNQVESARTKDPSKYQTKNAYKRLATIIRLAFESIPEDPTRKEYRQGDTLGSKYKHWFRCKFFQQYRLFFRYNLEEKTIILGWVNDENTKRAYESKTDAYVIFKSMLDNGNPPNDWNQLLKEAKNSTNLTKLQKIRDNNIIN